MPRRPPSVLDTLGAEITAIVTPVSICMLIVVMLVLQLTPHGAPDVGPSVGSLVYVENSTDTSLQRLGGAILNALVFILTVTVATFILVCMFYFRCTKFIWGYMAFSGFMIFAWLGGGIAVQLIQIYGIPVDIITFSIVVYNFAVVGVLAVFFCKMPIFLTQSYLVFIGAVVAFWFTHLPEWTTWVLLFGMAVYDLIAVLTPGGPLKLLLDLAMEREEEIPALIYEARPSAQPRPAPGPAPTGSGQRRRLMGRFERRLQARGVEALQGGAGSEDGLGDRVGLLADENVEAGDDRSGPRGGPGLQLMDLGVRAEERREVVGGEEGIEQVEEVDSGRGVRGGRGGGGAGDSGKERGEEMVSGGDKGLSQAEGEADEDVLPGEEREEEAALLHGIRGRQGYSEEGGGGGGGSGSGDRDLIDDVVHLQREWDRGRGGVGGAASHGREEEGEEYEDFAVPSSIKLGLGDFIFYSVLVGRAAMYDLMTVFASYLAIVAGLGATLVLLAVFKKALPALPISIALGMLFYLLTRLIVEPYVMLLALNLTLV